MAPGRETRMRHFDVVRVVLLAGAASSAVSIGVGCNNITGGADLRLIGSGAGPSAPTNTGGAGGEASSSTGMPMTQCVYPTTGLGFSVGKVVPPMRKWQGFPDNTLATS